MYSQVPAPPVGLLDEGKGNMEIDSSTENPDDWQRFREAGFLDQHALALRDREALIARLSRLHKELNDYQYTMGLLLLEKNEYNAKCDELSEALKEAHENINREQADHRIGIDEVEKREKNLRQELDAEKQSVADLEKALRETCFEYEQVKLTSDNKLSDAAALVNGIRDKSNDIEQKLYAVNAKLSEANSKSSELERKLQEVEGRETALKRERISFKMEREALEASILRHREGLQRWERKLQEGEEKLCEGRRLVNQREETLNDIEKNHKQKERELGEKTKTMDFAHETLKEKQEKLSGQLVELTLKEEKISSIRRNVEAKERELNWRTENLNSRETVIQNNIDGYKMDLDLKKHEFEAELGRKRKAFDDEIRERVHDLEQRDTEFSHTLEKFQKQEQALENKSQKYKAKEKEIEVQEKLLKEREKSFKTEKKGLKFSEKEIISLKECMETCKYEIEKLQADISQKRQQICEETEKLELIRDDKAEHFRVLMELKQEIGRVRNQQELQSEEGEILKKDRQKSKEEWKELDEKIDDVAQEMQKLNREKEMFEKERLFVEEQLNSDKLATEDLKRRGYEAIRLERESFAATMRHEQLAFSESAENGHRQLKHEYETQKMELEIDMKKKKDEMERTMQERRKALKKEEEADLNDIEKLKKSIENEIKEMGSRKQRLKKEEEEVSLNKTQLEEHQSGMQQDISELVGLSTMVKNQREHFIKERSRFISFVERLCGSCSDSVSNRTLLDHYVNEANDVEGSPFPITEEELVDQATCRRSAHTDQRQVHMAPSSLGSGSGAATLVKCASRLFPIDKLQNRQTNKLPSEELQPSTTSEMKCNVAIEEDVKLSSHVGDNPLAHSRTAEVPESSEQSELGRSRRKGASKSKKTTSSRSSHKAVIGDGTPILANMSKGPLEVKEGSCRENMIAEKPAGKSGRKRSHGQTSNTTGNELQPDSSEEHPESVAAGGHNKRRNTRTLAYQTPENKRYNLRSKKAVGIISEPDMVHDDEKTIEGRVPVDGGLKADVVHGDGKMINGKVPVDGGSIDMIPNPEAASARSLETSYEQVNRTPGMKVTTYRKLEIQEVSSHRVLESTSPSDGIYEIAPPESPNTGMSEDIAGTPVHNVEDEHDSTSYDNDSDDDASGDGDDNPGEVSVGRKIWTFFTS